MSSTRRIWGVVFLVLSLGAFYNAATLRYELGLIGVGHLEAFRQNPTPETKRAWEAAFASRQAAEARGRRALAGIGLMLMTPALWFLMRHSMPVPRPVPHGTVPVSRE